MIPFSLGAAIPLLLLVISSWNRSLNSLSSIHVPPFRSLSPMNFSLSFQSNPTRILCWIPIRNYTDYAVVNLIRNSWGSSCDKLVFTTHTSSLLENVTKLDFRVEDDLWNMIHPAWNYMDEHFVEDFDWFVKVDDDTYFNGHNFKHLVRHKNASDIWYLGYALHGVYIPISDPTGKFNLGGAYAISRGTLKQVGPHLPNSIRDSLATKCRRSKSWAEDIIFANCLRTASIPGPSNSRDEFNRTSFMLADPFHALKRYMLNEDDRWEFKGVPKNVPTGVNCCSSRPISWHMGKNRPFWLLDYLLQRIRVDPIIFLAKQFTV